MAALRELADITHEAYHGTVQAAAASIMKKGFILPAVGTENSRYGNGVYFWMNSRDQAIWWASRRVTAGTVITVLKSKVALGRHLNLVSWEGQKLMQDVANQIAAVKPGLKLTDALVLNLLAKKGWMETALILDYPDKTPETLFTGSLSVTNARLILCVYKVEKILETTISVEQAA